MASTTTAIPVSNVETTTTTADEIGVGEVSARDLTGGRDRSQHEVNRCSSQVISVIDSSGIIVAGPIFSRAPKGEADFVKACKLQLA